MFKNFIISFLLVVSICVSIACGVLHYRLEQTRQQLEHYRMELELAKDRESDIAESIRRTGEILNSSVSTLSGIRAQISEIRKSYEEMENRLYSSGVNNSDDDDNTVYNEGDEIDVQQ